MITDSEDTTELRSKITIEYWLDNQGGVLVAIGGPILSSVPSPSTTTMLRVPLGALSATSATVDSVISEMILKPLDELLTTLEETTERYL